VPGIGRVRREAAEELIDNPLPTVTPVKVRPSPRWWLPSAFTATTLVAFIAYSTYAVLVNRDYYVRPYLSPLYSPCVALSCPDRFGPLVGSWWRFSPAILALIVPVGFRLTCYYYRKAYYRSFLLTPAACGVRDARRRYSGETRLPLVAWNLHRYLWYLALPFNAYLTYDAVQAFRFPGGIGVGPGTVLLCASAATLWLYSFSCHSCRHLCGGCLDNFDNAPTRYSIWSTVSRLNRHHMLIAWVSLSLVMATDLFIRLVAIGAIPNWRLML
jgi:hypothetical protein